MIFEEYEKEARHILRYQKSPEKVEEFIKLCSEIKSYGSLDDFMYRPEKSIEFKANDRAFKLIRRLITLQITTKTQYVNLKILVDGLERAFMFLQLNESLNTGGSPGSLSIGDLFRLMMLKTFFEGIFPSRSNKFTKDNILHRLGVALTGKPL